MIINNILTWALLLHTRFWFIFILTEFFVLKFDKTSGQFRHRMVKG
jgi:hypothetical protein